MIYLCDKMERVNILVEALPYIKKFYNKKVMIKYGGHAMVDDEAMERLWLLQQETLSF